MAGFVYKRSKDGQELKAQETFRAQERRDNQLEVEAAPCIQPGEYRSIIFGETCVLFLFSYIEIIN